VERSVDQWGLGQPTLLHRARQVILVVAGSG
jgi:hypothetical protein